MYTVTQSKKPSRDSGQHTFNVEKVPLKGKLITMRFINRPAAEDFAARLNAKPPRTVKPKTKPPTGPRLSARRDTLYLPASNLAGVGVGHFTFVLPSGEHITARIGRGADFSLREQNHYKTVGALNLDRRELEIWLDKITRQQFDLIKPALEGIEKEPFGAAHTYAMESGRCYRCGKELTEPTSIVRGIGPDCLDALTGTNNQYLTPAEKASIKERFLAYAI